MNYFISGITGSLGQIVAEKLLAEGHRVIGFSRDECKQAALKKREGLTLYLGDIRHQKRLLEATRGAEEIFHFAALKHVDQLEKNPEEAIETNILGTENILHAQRAHRIKRVTLSSTDKAVYPINVYGMSKGIAERLTLRNPNNVVCRYGNVCASRGSVIPQLVKSLREESKVYLTDPNMSRFWITLEDASAFVIHSARGRGGLQIPPMRAAPLSLLAEIIAGLLNVKSYEIIQIGSRPGEKLVECLRTEYEGEELYSHRASQFTGDELAKMLRPIVEGL